MSITATATQNFEPIPLGVHAAICVGLFDLGTSINEMFGNRAHRVCITWEFPQIRIQLIKDGEILELPRQLSQLFTLSLSEKANLRKVLTSWRGRSFTDGELRGFDLKAILGKPCSISILHDHKNGKTYSKIGAVLPPMVKGIKAESPLLSYDFDVNGRNIPEGVPQWIRNEIIKSDEWIRLTTPGPKHRTDDVPDFIDEEVPPEEILSGSYIKPEDRDECPF